ncbi:MAG: hypothetical protein O2960_25880 [Verrucomicrobia bacterium]|nr:hypothetical protein [Verrucomicrobiota bacterium]
MIKSDEIQILRDAADKLTANSYCGPWLRSVISTVESDIRSDFMPSPTMEATRQLCAGELASARREAAQILTTATDEAKKLKDKSLRFADSVRSSLREAIRQADRALNE